MISRISNLTEGLLALPFLQSIDRYYPNLSYWYVNTVLPNINDGTSVLLFDRSNGALNGVCLGKKGPENKLRCVRVRKDIQNTGLGVRLMDAMLEELEDRNPLATVSEDLFHQYSRIFVRRYGFRLEAVEKGLYVPGKLEYVFNGGLK